MKLIYLESKDNPKIKHLRSLIEQHHYRKKHQQSVIEGSHLALAYLEYAPLSAVFTTEAALQHDDLIQIQQKSSTPIFILSPAQYKTLSGLGTSLPCLAIIDLKHHLFSLDQINYQRDTLILDQIQDPGNVGTLLRSAAAANIKQIICTQGTAAIWSPRVVRAGMGAHFSLHCFENMKLEHCLTQFKLPIYATSSHHAHSLYQLDLRQPHVWILGNEGQGVSEFALQHAQAVTIPQPGGQESLNVAVAGSICLFEMVRQRLSTK